MARNVISVVSTGPVGPGGPPNNVGMMVGCQYYLYRGIGLVDEKRRRKGPARDDSTLESLCERELRMCAWTSGCSASLRVVLRVQVAIIGGTTGVARGRC
jgi:hypothetical protein